MPTLLIILESNINDKNYSMLYSLLRLYKEKLQEFILGENEDMFNMIKQELNTNNKKCR